MRCLVALGLFLALLAAADAQEVRGPYIGGSIGHFNYKQGRDEGLPFSDGATSHRFLAGWQINESYAVELGRGSSGDIKESFLGLDSEANLATLDLEAEYELTTVRFLMTAPFSRFGMFGGIGYYDADVEGSWVLHSPVDGFTEAFKESEDGLLVVGGIQYEWDRIALRGEYEWLDTDGDVEASSIGVTLLFRF